MKKLTIISGLIMLATFVHSQNPEVSNKYEKDGVAIEDWETGDFTKFLWVAGGSTGWLISNSVKYEGTYSAESGNINDNQTSELSVSIEVANTDNISFYRKVSSEGGWDFLRFYIDGNQMDQWSGELAWGMVSYPVSAGTHTFKWEYYKDGSVSGGSDCGWIDYIEFPVSEDTSYFDLKIFIEGPFNGIDMNTSLNNSGLIPLLQPYNSTPWNYEGTESVSVIPNANVVDWILVELRETSGNAHTADPNSVISRKAAFLLSNGQIVDLDGVSLLEFNLAIIDNLYAVLLYRNHLAIMTSTPLIESKGNYTYDFTDNISKAYLGGIKEIASGIYGMTAGDCDGNGIIENEDKINFWSIVTGKKGYEMSDLNIDTEINNIDKDDFWNVNIGLETKVPDEDFFICGELLSDSRDEQEYETTLIGTQCWMAENLNIGMGIDGSQDQTQNNPTEIIEKYCYDNNESNCDTYGGLYQWNELMQYITTPGTQGICPQGWHIPTDHEWKVLEGMADSQYGVGDPQWHGISERGYDVGSNLKTTSSWNSGGNGTDIFNFAVLPGGRIVNDNFEGIGNIGYFSTSNQFDGNSAWRRYLSYSFPEVSRNEGLITNGFSVRCLKDYTNQSPTQPTIPLPEDGSIDIGIDTVLSWACSDPDGNDLFYKIHFGTVNPPPFVVAGLTETSYDPGILNYNTTYYWKIVAFDLYGDSISGNIWSFSTYEPGNPCPGIPTVYYVNKTYNTVKIGDQCWFRENLNIGTHIEIIGINLQQTDNGIIEKYCYNNDTIYCDTYGGLYQWNEMMQYTTVQGVQGICPNGWHVPTDDEWTTLIDYLGGAVVAGGKMKEEGIIHWNLPNSGATNESGFTGLPAGTEGGSGYFDGLGTNCTFWASSQYINGAGLKRGLKYNNFAVSSGWADVSYGFSVRCLKD